MKDTELNIMRLEDRPLILSNGILAVLIDDLYNMCKVKGLFDNTQINMTATEAMSNKMTVLSKVKCKCRDKDCAFEFIIECFKIPCRLGMYCPECGDYIPNAWNSTELKEDV